MSIDTQVLPGLAEWQERLPGRAVPGSRRAATDRRRAELRRRREHGLVERHADRLAHIRGCPGPFPPDPESSEW